MLSRGHLRFHMLDCAGDLLSKLNDVKRFADKIESSEVTCFGRELLRVDPRQYDNGTIGMNLFDAPQYLDAVGFWHQHIQQHQVGASVPDLRESAVDVICLQQSIAFAEHHFQ